MTSTSGEDSDRSNTSNTDDETDHFQILSVSNSIISDSCPTIDIDYMLIKLKIEVLDPSNLDGIEDKHPVANFISFFNPKASYMRRKKRKDELALTDHIGIGYFDCMKVYMPKDRKDDFVQALEEIGMRYYSSHIDPDQLLTRPGILSTKALYNILKQIKIKHIILTTWGMKLTNFDDFIQSLNRFTPDLPKDNILLIDLAVDIPLQSLLQEHGIQPGFPVCVNLHIYIEYWAPNTCKFGVRQP